MWSKVRASLSDASVVLVPTWLPATVDRAVVNAVTSRGASDTYAVTYGSSSSPTVTLSMGPVKPDEAGSSGMGLKVRGHNAVLSHPSDAHARAGLPKQVTWVEEGRHYAIRSESLSGDDVMRIAWALESGRPPARPFPYARERVGACSVPGIGPEALLQRLLSLVGSGDEAAIADCFALEALESAPGAWRSWAALPRTRDVAVRQVYWFGGRQIAAVSWTFERDPGGAWGPSVHRFFTVGLDGDRLRVYEMASAPSSLPR